MLLARTASMSRHEMHNRSSFQERHMIDRKPDYDERSNAEPFQGGRIQT